MAAINDDDIDDKGHGPEVAAHMTWIFKLSKPDALLVLKALRGTLKGPEIEQARELCDRLTVLRQKIGADITRGLDKAYDNMMREREDAATETQVGQADDPITRGIIESVQRLPKR